MSQVHDLLEQLLANNIQLFVEDGKLKFNAPQGAFTPELKALVGECKPSLIELLSRQQPPISKFEKVEDTIWQPVSYEQKRMWFMERFQDNNGALHIPVALDWQGELDRFVMERAFKTVINRHSALKTKYTQKGLECMQQVLPEVDFNLAFADVSEKEEAQQDQILETEWKNFVNAKFQLEHGELVRAKLFKLAPKHHVLWLVSHHIAVDAIAIEILFSELAQCIIAGEGGLSPVELQFIDYAVWQNKSEVQQNISEKAKQYQQWLGNIPRLHSLVTDYSRPAMQSFNGKAVHSLLTKETTHALKKLAQQSGVTLFSVLQAAYAILLKRNGIGDKVVFAYPAANRSAEELRHVVGSFVNMVMTSIEVNPSHTLRDLCIAAHKAGQQSLSFQDVPFDLMVDLCLSERSAAFHPLYQITIGLQPSPKTLTLGESKITPVPLSHDTCKHDLGLDLTETEEGLKARWEFNTDIFAQTRISQMAQQFDSICQALICQPDSQIASFSLHDVTSDNAESAVDSSKGTETSLRLIPDYIQEQAVENPSSAAIISEDQTLTFNELNEQANQMAAVLRNYGVEEGTFVGICVDIDTDTYIALLAILKLGAAYVPLDLSYPSERLDAIMNDVPLVCVLGSADNLDLLPVPIMPFFSMEDYDELRNQFTPEMAQVNPILPEVDPRDLPAYVVFTSGSTGLPKGIVANHAGVVRMVAEDNFIKLQSNDVWLQASSLAFDAATWEIWGVWMHGAAIAPMSKADLLSPDRLRRVVNQANVTGVFLTTALFNSLVSRHIDILQDMNFILFGGEESNPEITRSAVENLSDCKIYHMYGPTENTTFSTFCYLTPEILQKYNGVPLGGPIGKDSIFVLDENLQSVAPGGIGELAVSGNGLACHYLNAPDETAAKFVPAPFTGYSDQNMYLTGDIVKWVDGEQLLFVGRKDEQVKVNGFRIELGEIERVLAKQPFVQECVVAVKEEEQGQKRICAYFIPENSQNIESKDLAQLTATVRHEGFQQLPDYMKPHYVHCMSEFPLNNNGKIDKHLLPLIPVDQSEQVMVTELSANEMAVLSVWEEVLGRQNLQPDADFFEQGGDSLQVMVMCDLAKQKLQVEVPMRAFFNEPTIQFIALLMDEPNNAPEDYEETMVEIEI